MKTFDEFLMIVNEELGLAVSADESGRDLAEIDGWDSMHLLWLVSAMEQETGASISVIDLLEAPDLASIYRVMSGSS